MPTPAFTRRADVIATPHSAGLAGRRRAPGLRDRAPGRGAARRANAGEGGECGEGDAVGAAEARLRAVGAAPIAYLGEAEQPVRKIVDRLNPPGLHFAFLDPFNLDDLPFSIIETFNRLQRIDMLIHVSAQDLQRNLDTYTKAGDNRLERFAPGWRQHVDLSQSQRGIRAGILAYWAGKIEQLGLSSAEHAELITGSERNQRLYWLVMVSRHKLAKEFWDKIRNVSGQGELL